jgi:hypothetical protein
VTIEEQIKRLDDNVGDLIRCVMSLKGKLFLEELNHWSPRDIVAHLTGWNRYLIDGSKQIMRGELPFYDVDPGDNYSKVNAVLVQEYSSRDRRELLDDLRASAGELTQFLQSLDPHNWDHDYGVRHKGLNITVRNSVDELIDDYAHHREQIEKWAKESQVP